jgi:hypothetical protein
MGGEAPKYVFEMPKCMFGREFPHQLSRGTNFTYILHLAHIVARWKALIKHYNIVAWYWFTKGELGPLNLYIKHHLGPQNGPESLEPRKSEKIITKLPRWRTALSQWKRWVATNIHLDHKHFLVPTHTQISKNIFRL